ncbi:uncharacterized protein LOC126912067 [Spodoptera frugiperda]|uniref:Uncharacterized protein LOC118279495 n=2 Tax=Spodoptera frugiperda TaxID=7108 RepID=A0A9R0DIY3_SPOFR|nr:uncharacterized protein LOC118279495 [Spodoptera frugiperda]XP_035455022.2 uncharacterized protein LOC118279496 [Spodoptera frugiperda]XP_035455031.2 uncharacterized protein LOC118279504 [Spodoptera frugiperda]XP_035455034.2 uncharacterized protein LOC118279508 [Spodoptera frugiperda]XP_035455037.2 uncharacterized protein LOC118279509 [Spodoptera frugiperda]XP_050558246.1 uncharacterized protein LOC126912067 [Spodoptera frugiperda]
MVVESFSWSEEVESADPMIMEEQRETRRDSVNSIEPEVKTPQTPETKSSVDEEDGALKDLLRVDEQYYPLLALLEQFSPEDDGIQFNIKLKQFETTMSSMCPDDSRVQQAFATFRAAALRCPVMARKLAAVGVSFTRQQNKPLLRRTLLNVVMQDTFSKLDVLQRSNPLFLVNAANLMGDYFANARLSNGDKLHFLAEPLLQYLRALLAAHDTRAHHSLAAQLMQNGRELLSVVAQEMDELSVSIRLRLLSPPPVSTTWLLLSADLCLNKFLPLPTTLQQFYTAHLVTTTEENVSEASYRCWKKSPEKNENKPDAAALAEEVSQSISQISLRNNEDTKPKKEPISVSQDTWTGDDTLRKRYDLNSWRQTEETRIKANDCQQGGDIFQSHPERNVSQAPEKPKLGVGARLLRLRALSKESISVSEDTWSGPDSRPPHISMRSRKGRINGKKDGTTAKATPRRHVAEVPRSAKYWGHDDRCVKHYS